MTYESFAGSWPYVPDKPDAPEGEKAYAHILIYGSASIVQQLTNLGLIDEYQLLVFPVLLGGGKPLFKDIHEKQNLRLASTTPLPSGVVLLTYQR